MTSIYTEEYLIELLDAALQEITMEYTHGYNKLPRDRVKREMMENACTLTSIVRDRRAKRREATAKKIAETPELQAAIETMAIHLPSLNAAVIRQGVDDAIAAGEGR